ncbi:hypothetical protein Pelo_905 [Pelomyxa schiedti]|nr:hypothetical protein Pelo_905 [Pelomyxa schiedti]
MEPTQKQTGSRKTNHRGATAHGLSRTNELVPILDFYKSQVLPDICNKNAHAIIRADCIKFIYMFRAQLVMETTDYQNLFTTLTAALQDSNIVVKTYAAAAVERFLILRDVSTIPPTLSHPADTTHSHTTRETPTAWQTASARSTRLFIF